MNSRRLIASIAVRNNGSRLYGKPLQNLDVAGRVSILDNIVDCLNQIECIDEIVLGIAEGIENTVYAEFAKSRGISYIVGDEVDVLSRLIACCESKDGTDVFRVTSESPFPSFQYIQSAWRLHTSGKADATFLDEVIDGCGFEIISLETLQKSHRLGSEQHRSELCSLFIRENADAFNLVKVAVPEKLIRPDLRLTVDNPEDLIVCRAVFAEFKKAAPLIPLDAIVDYVDSQDHLKKLIEPLTEEGYQSMYL